MIGLRWQGERSFWQLRCRTAWYLQIWFISGANMNLYIDIYMGYTWDISNGIYTVYNIYIYTY